MQPSANSMTKAEKKFAIVSFPDEYEHLFIVASRWLFQDELSQHSCFWPPYKSEETVKISVLRNEKPETTWQKYSANLVIKCKTYEGAESIRDSIMKISARQSSLLFDQLQKSMSSWTKPPSKELQFKSCVVPNSSLLTFNDVMRKLIGMNIENVSFSLKEMPVTVSVESPINVPNILKASTSCQTEEIYISSTINTDCDSCKSKGIISKPPTETNVTKQRDGTSVGTRLQCITCMKEHKDKSLEELRVEASSSGTSGATSISDCFEEKEFQPMFDAASANSSTLSWSAIKFKPPTETNIVIKGNTSTSVGTRLQCITCMKEYEDKSLEELRMRDLCLGVYSASQFSFSQQKTTHKSILDATNENVFAARWTANKFKPPTETNVMVVEEIPFCIGTRLQCITCMEEYKDKSLEELRVEELKLGTFKTSMQPTNPFRATFPFSSTFAFTFKKPIRKQIYPLLFGTSGTTDGFKGTETSHYSSIKIRPVAESDVGIKAGKIFPFNVLLQSITCMKEYEDKSFEELRMEYLVVGHKESSKVGTVFQKPAKLSHAISVLKRHSSTVSFSNTNYKPVIESTGMTDAHKRTEASSYSAIKFEPVTGSDSIVKDGQCFPIKTRLQNITCMKEHKDKSVEELRVEYLVADHTVSSPGTVIFGTPGQSLPFTFALNGGKSKSAFDTKSKTRSFNKYTNKNTFGINVKPAWHNIPFGVLSSPSGAKTV